ncbi:MAG: SMC-Scp complex subunit ScpB [Candidatus Pacebacteria bacterium]|nr:SMC-Scp complex subunit ScpB [Candidatus Paceibacterota bacterium]
MSDINQSENSNGASLEKQIEAVLFWKGEPISIKKLSQIFSKTEEEISNAVKQLEEKLVDRGITLIFKEDEVTLGTSKEVSEIIEKLTKEELVKDLGKAGLETLSIIIYQGPISRAEIDYIRGVQSNFILRNLMIRGLVEKVTNPKDQRSFLYKPTFEMLSYLGVSKIEEMPEYLAAKAEIESYKNNPEQVADDNKVEDNIEVTDSIDNSNVVSGEENI